MRLAWLTGVLLLLAPTMASAADTCVCWTGLDAPASESSPELLRRLTELQEAEAQRVAAIAEGTFRLRAPNTAAELEPGDILSRPLDEIASLPPAPPPERVLWCDGSDDPRCSQGTPPPVSAEVASGPPGAITHTSVRVFRRERSSSRHAHAGLDAHVAASPSLERPPRA
ncbi:MAG: hypothetical protein MUE69_02745 [Myxococcota bacterium]|jgi:hypothetical protein|nr:hypothetical protein [Myxococcota bacterium]